MKKAIPGSLTHLRKICYTLSGVCDRPRLDDNTRYILIGLIRQEIIRRNILASDTSVLQKMGIDIKDCFPDFVVNSTKKN